VIQHRIVGRCQCFRGNGCAPIFYPNLEATGSSKSSVPTKLHDTMFQKTCPLLRSLRLTFITHLGTECWKTWSYLRNCQTECGWNFGLWVLC